MKIKSVYISSYDFDNSLFILQLLKCIEGRFHKIAIFKPIKKRNSDRLYQYKQCTKKSVIDVFDTGYDLKNIQSAIALNCIDDIIQICIEQIEAIKDKYDFIIVEGLSRKILFNKIGFDINLEIAKNINTPIINILNINAQKTVKDILNQIKIEKNEINKACVGHLLTIIINNNKLLYKNLQEHLKSIDIDIMHQLIEKRDCLHLDKNNQDKLSNTLEKSIFTQVVTPIMFKTKLFSMAKKNKKRIVLPESSDDRILQASSILLHQDIVDIILLGDKEEILSKARLLHVDISKATIINPKTYLHLDEYAKELHDIRKSKGLTLDEAKKTVLDVNYFATMMVYKNHADGMVSGAIHTTAETIRPALQIIKTKPDVSIISSIFFMCLDTNVLVYGDCAINPNPTSEELVQIAISSANTAKAFDIDAKIAMLSYSTGNSGKGNDVEKVKIALNTIKNKYPNLLIDGPIQYDAAVDLDVAKAKLPDSKVAGKANVFIFPTLDAGNITYKAVQRSAKAVAIGPVLQGLKKPINDLSRGCLVEDIVNTVAITAIQTMQTKE